MATYDLVARHRDVVAALDALARPDGTVAVDVPECDAGVIETARTLKLLDGDPVRAGGRFSGTFTVTDTYREALAVHRRTLGCVAGLVKAAVTAPEV